jgi:two-component system, cell cycle response regulator DivK
LIVEDHRDQREMYASYFAAKGFRAFTAVDGPSALIAARAELPDVIVMDLSLPHITGWEATRRLKDDPRTAAIPIIACTAHVLGNSCERAVDAGCSAFLTKPCLPIELFAEVKRILRPRAA